METPTLSLFSDQVHVAESEINNLLSINQSGRSQNILFSSFFGLQIGHEKRWLVLDGVYSLATLFPLD